MAQKPKKQPKRRASKNAKRNVVRPSRARHISSVAHQVTQLINAANSVPGTPFRDMERIFRPVARAVVEQEEVQRRLHASAQTMYVYLNEQLNIMVGQGYDMDEVKKISDILHGAVTALVEYGMVGLETYSQHLEDGLQRMKDLIEVGTGSPR